MHTPRAAFLSPDRRQGRCLWSRVPPIASFSVIRAFTKRFDAWFTLHGCFLPLPQLHVWLLHIAKWLFNTPGDKWINMLNVSQNCSNLLCITLLANQHTDGTPHVCGRCDEDAVSHAVVSASYCRAVVNQRKSTYSSINRWVDGEKIQWSACYLYSRVTRLATVHSTWSKPKCIELSRQSAPFLLPMNIWSDNICPHFIFTSLFAQQKTEVQETTYQPVMSALQSAQ